MENLKEKNVGFVIRPSFWLLAAVSFLAKSGWLFVLYTASVLIHEFAHFFIAKKCGYNCKNVSLSAFGAVLYGDFDDVDPASAVKIAVAGPLANIILAISVIAFWWIYPSSYAITRDLAVCNLVLAVTNFLPCYPLDGGRVLVAALQKKLGFVKAIKTGRTAAIAVGCAFFALFIIGFFLKINLYSCGLFGFFLVVASSGETKKAIYTRRVYVGGSKSRAKRGAEKKCLVFDGETTLAAVAKKLRDNCFYQLTVLMDEDNFFILEQPQINFALLHLPLDTKLKKLYNNAV